MNIVRSRIPILGTILAVVLSTGLAFVPAPLEAQRPQSRKPAAEAAPAIQPGTPCCEIATVDARAGLVTAKHLRTGKSFRFRVADARLLGSLKVGQRVYVDDAAEKAGFTPSDPCCNIVAAPAPAAAATPRPTPAQPVDGVRPAQPVNGVAPAAPINGVTPGDDRRASEYAAIIAQARAIDSPLDDRGIARFDERIAPVHAALRSWADRHGAELVSRSFSCAELAATAAAQPAAAGTRPNTVASCPSYVRSGNDDCMLIGATMVGDEMICEYECSPSLDKDRQDDVKVMQENQ